MTPSPIDRAVTRYAQAPDERSLLDAVVAAGLDALEPLRRALEAELPIGRVERIERAIKGVLRAAMSGPLPGADARRIARFQQRLGFLHKVKSYCVKAATPLGYSVFLQSPGQGFSFQRHLSHKVEAFRILEVAPGGFVFICSHADWADVYEPEAFAAWLAGRPDDRYERFRFTPEPGDTFVVDQLGVVHSVVGCALEEFATASTDMVDRLHDPNAGRPIPDRFTRAFARAEVARVGSPARDRRVELLSPGREVVELAREPVTGGARVTLVDSFVRAGRWLVEPGATTDPERDERRASVLRVVSGRGSLALGERAELAGDDAALPFEAGDLLTVAPGAWFQVRSGGGPVELSEHRIEPEEALGQ